jgi:lysophospholipase L1-like esterase
LENRLIFPVAAILLAPLLLLQGAWTRYRTPRLQEPAGARRGSAGDGPPLRILIAGDSAAAGVGVRHQQLALSGQLERALASTFSVYWQLEAVTGARTEQTVRSLRDLPSAGFDVVVVSLGVNDVTGLSGREHFERQQRALWSLLIERFGARLLVVCGLPPMHRFPALPQPLRLIAGARAQQFTSILQRAAAETEECEFLAMQGDADPSLVASDGFHPGAGVYALWAERVAAIIASRFPVTSSVRAE